MKTQYEVSAIWISWLVLGIYLVALRFLIKDPLDEYSLLLTITKSDGVMICSAITVVKLTELIRLKLFNPISRFMLILVIYVVIYGLRAGPYMIASFFQPIARNVLAQFFLLFLLIELCLHYIGLNLARKRR